MPADPLETPVVAPEPRASRKLKCEFCECVLAVNGDVLQVSDRARRLRKADEEIESLEGTIAELRHQIETNSAESPVPSIEIPPPPSEPDKQGFRWW